MISAPQVRFSLSIFYLYITHCNASGLSALLLLTNTQHDKIEQNMNKHALVLKILQNITSI